MHGQRLVVQAPQDLAAQTFADLDATMGTTGGDEVGGLVHDAAVDMHAAIILPACVLVVHVVWLVAVYDAVDGFGGIVLAAVGGIGQVATRRRRRLEPVVLSLQPVAIDQGSKDVGHGLVQSP